MTPTPTPTNTATPTPTPELSDPLDSEGGTVIFDEGKIEFDVPQGALDTETQFSYVPYSSLSHSSDALRFSGISFQLTAQEITTGDPVRTFDPPLAVTIYYDPASLGDIPADSLGLYFWDEDGALWRDVVTTCADGEYLRNIDQNWFGAPLCHLSEFAVLGDDPTDGDSFSIFLPLILR